MKDLIALPAEHNELLKAFTEPADRFKKGIDSIKQLASELPSNMQDGAARDEVRSFAYRVAQTKSAVDKAGKELTDHYKELPKRIDATRKLYRETLDALRDEVRAPLTAYEEAEKAKQAALDEGIERLKMLGSVHSDVPSPRLTEIIEEIESFDLSGYGEMLPVVTIVKSDALKAVQATLAARLQYEAEQEELAKLREEAAKRADQDRIDAAKHEAEQAQRLAEERALAAERAKLEAEKQAEARRIEAAKQAEVDRAAAAEQARQAEIERQKQQVEQEAAAQAKREADQDHRRLINRQVASDLVAHAALTEEQAKAVVIAIASKQISYLTIGY